MVCWPFRGFISSFFLKKKKKSGKHLLNSSCFQNLTGRNGLKESCGATQHGNLISVSQLHVQGSFCSSKVLCSSGLAENQQYWVFHCQANVKYKQFLCKGAPVMPVTPNLFGECLAQARRLSQTDSAQPLSRQGSALGALGASAKCLLENWSSFSID